MNIVILMTESVKEFAESGICTPKPLIKIGRKPMYHYALESLPLALELNSRIHHCDVYFSSQINWQALYQSNIDGAIVLFPAKENERNYAQLYRDKSKITGFKEKDMFLFGASTGPYFFSQTKAFIRNVEKAILEDIRVNNKFYLSTIYNNMINKGELIKPLWGEKLLCFATPKDLINSFNNIISEDSYREMLG